MRVGRPVLALAAWWALAGSIACDPTGRAPSAPAAPAPEPVVARAEPPPPPPPPPPIRDPEFGELLDAAMAGPVSLPEPARQTLRRLELAAGNRPVVVGRIDDEEAGWPARAEALLELADRLPEHGLRLDEPAAALVADLEALRVEALADGRFDRDEAANHARAIRMVHIEHASIALLLELARALGAVRPEPGEARRRAEAVWIEAFARWELPRALLATVPPATEPYDRLRAALPRYRALDQGEGFVPVPAAVRKARPGKRHAGIGALRARLAQEDPLGAGAGDLWDAALTDALRRARQAYQLSRPRRDAGLIDKALLEALDVPVGERLDCVLANLERMRHSDLRDHPYAVYIVLPDFHGEVWDGPERLLRFKTVVGNTTRHGAVLVNATPELTARIDTVIYNPYWNVPPRIFQEELLRDESKWQDAQAARAEAGEDPLPDFWEAKRFEVMNADNPETMWVRRKPGPGNALGKVKFMFENRYFVFLHDTSDKAKFRQVRRAFSHGCMRVEKPLQLAELLLRRDGTWHVAEEEHVLSHTRETPISLEHPVPIVVDYLTARASDDGRVHFLTDIYGRDRDRVAER
ncbi:MAG: L,D-transpeptidase family protein [Deltaproteobacteria bacterium]|nr:L,D-transpeptidase family protein [Deltaproteobacteria bacterium]